MGKYFYFKEKRIMQKEFTPAVLPELNYGYASLEPVLISEIIEVHHKKHHAGYATKYNNFAQQLIDAHYKGDTNTVQRLCDEVHFNAGGYNTHNVYWENLAPKGNPGGLLPDENSKLAKLVCDTFG